jgi:hypothetical protein
MSRRRPWRALATEIDWTSATGRRVVGHCAACTLAGLNAWVREHRAAGHAVSTWQVQVLTEAPVTPTHRREDQPVA